jgi:hypothetical protein
VAVASPLVEHVRVTGPLVTLANVLYLIGSLCFAAGTIVNMLR